MFRLGVAMSYSYSYLLLLCFLLLCIVTEVDALTVGWFTIIRKKCVHCPHYLYMTALTLLTSALSTRLASAVQRVYNVHDSTLLSFIIVDNAYHTGARHV